MKSIGSTMATAALAMLLAGCGGGGSDGAQAPNVVTVTPTPAATPAPSPTPAPVATSWGAALYDVLPNIANCSTGTLKPSVRTSFFTRLNALRALHGLSAVTYSDVENEQQMQSSLMMVVNKRLSHETDASWTCYSAGGASGAAASNLAIVYGRTLAFDIGEDGLAMWMTEGGGRSLGHRRWILSPFLGKTSYGRVALELPDGLRLDATTMRVFSFSGGSGPAPSTVPAFVAYPYGSYPAEYFRATDYLSFTAIASRTTSGGSNGNVNYSGATISVTGPSGALAVSDVSSDNASYGVANNLQWRVAGLQTGVTYDVRISGITGAPQSSYNYSFRMMP